MSSGILNDMNIHPLFVHFPIALLIMYSILELASWGSRFVRRQAWVVPTKAFLLFTGVLAGFATLVTGEMAEEIVGRGARSYIIEVHAPFAGMTIVLYLVLAVAYLVRIFDRHGWAERIVGHSQLRNRLWGIKKWLAHMVLDVGLLPLIVLLALCGMTVTGALGASIVYGPHVDPFVSFIYHLFWAQ